MKLKDTFMSSPICVKILKYQCISKNFPLLCRQFFSANYSLRTIFYEKGNPPPPPPIKSNGPSLKKYHQWHMLHSDTK